MPQTKWTTREEWLIAAADQLRENVFGDHEVPAFRVSVGWPGGRGTKTTTVGQCWNTLASEDQVPQVFISPTIKDRSEVLRILTHEMIHVFDDCASGHRGQFLRVFRAIGMTGKATECDATEELRLTLADIADELGAYPHGALRKASPRAKTGEPKQTTRMLKLAAPTCCGYTVRTTQKWIDEGLPTCPHGTELEPS